jgi:hypothetical protein
MQRAVRLRKVVSGGQSGVDQAALRAALDCGLEIGGWCPPRSECDFGEIPAELPLRETPAEHSEEAPHVPRSLRTQWNVRDSDGTLVLQGTVRPPDSDLGTEWTLECTRRYARPCLVCPLGDSASALRIIEWIGAEKLQVLNVAGPSEVNLPGAGEAAYLMLKRVFSCLVP